MVRWRLLVFTLLQFKVCSNRCLNSLFHFCTVCATCTTLGVARYHTNRVSGVNEYFLHVDHSRVLNDRSILGCVIQKAILNNFYFVYTVQPVDNNFITCVNYSLMHSAPHSPCVDWITKSMFLQLKVSPVAIPSNNVLSHVLKCITVFSKCCSTQRLLKVGLICAA